MRRGETNTTLVNVLAAVAIVFVAVGQGVLAWKFTPPSVPAVAPVPAAEPELVIVTDSSGKRISDEAIEEVAGKLAIGQWRVQAIPQPGDSGWVRTIVVSEDVPPPPVSPPPPPPVTVKATAATYVYEKDATAIPSPVLAALNQLNREKKILATLFEADTTDGNSEIPAQYKTPLAAAKEAGLPALVVTAGGIVLEVVKNPTTEAAVLEAVP